MYIAIRIYPLYEAEKPSLSLYVCMLSRHIENSVNSAWIDSGLTSWLVFVLSFMEFVFINLLVLSSINPNV